MTGIYDLYERMEKGRIVLSFKGDITEELLNSIFSIVESHLDSTSDDSRRKKKFYMIVVECLQNLYHHIDPNESGNDGDRTGLFLIAYNEKEQLQLTTGNKMLLSKEPELKRSLEKINSMSSDELREYYREKLNSTTLSSKGGAGLGLLDIARKSGNKLEYSFTKMSDEYTFFSLTVTV